MVRIFYGTNNVEDPGNVTQNESFSASFPTMTGMNGALPLMAYLDVSVY